MTELADRFSEAASAAPASRHYDPEKAGI